MKTTDENEIFDVLNGKKESTKNTKVEKNIEPSFFNFNITDRELLTYKEVLKKSLEMFEFRGGYDCENFLTELRDPKSKINKSPKDFYEVIINSFPINPLSSIIINNLIKYKNNVKITEDSNIFYFGMSYLLQNSNGNYTMVFLIPDIKNSNQISIMISRFIIQIMFDFYVKTEIKFDEIVIIHSKGFNQEGLNLFKNLEDYFIQFFSIIEILSPAIDSIYTPRYRIVDKEEEKKIFENSYVNKLNLRDIEFRKDSILKYYGIRQNTMIEVMRINQYEDSTGIDTTYVYVYKK